MDKVDETSQDVNNLYNLTTSLAISLSYHQIVLYIRSVLANLWVSLSYIIKVSTHTMDYIDTATTGTFSPHILPIMDLKKVLSHIEETLPSTLHLPVSSEDTLHFCYLHTHVLIANKQFLLINVPIQDQSQQLTIYKIFTLDIQHGNFTAHYDVNTKCLRITQDDTMAVEISQQQFRICQEANGQFCTIPTPFQPLANHPSCISMPSQLAPNVWILTTAPSVATATITLTCPGETTQFIAVKRPIHLLHLPTACSATSPNFHLHPHYEGPPLEINISLDMANLNMINISSVNFQIWQHLEKHWNESQLLHLASIPSVPIGQLYHHLAKGFEHITPLLPEKSTGDTDSILTLFSDTGVYVIAIGLLISAGLGIFCYYFLWCQPARLACWPLTPGTMQYTSVDDDVEAATIYRCDSKASQPIRPHENHGLHMELIPTWMESWCKQQMKSLVVPAQGSLANMTKIQGTQQYM